MKRVYSCSYATKRSGSRSGKCSVSFWVLSCTVFRFIPYKNQSRKCSCTLGSSCCEHRPDKCLMSDHEVGFFGLHNLLLLRYMLWRLHIVESSNTVSMDVAVRMKQPNAQGLLDFYDFWISSTPFAVHFDFAEMLDSAQGYVSHKSTNQYKNDKARRLFSTGCTQCPVSWPQ